MNTKQVIVFRKDLLKGEHAIRKGKYAGQVAHASLASLLTLFNKTVSYNTDDTNHEDPTYTYSVSFGENSVLNDWLNGIFTKVVVSVPDEDSLRELAKKCEEAGLPHYLITDCGNTEFHGVPTVTCLGIGPYLSEEIDKLTKDLPLL